MVTGPLGRTCISGDVYVYSKHPLGYIVMVIVFSSNTALTPVYTVLDTLRTGFRVEM